MSRIIGFCLSLLLLSACGDLDTTYAARQGDSVNGVRVLRAELEARTQLTDAWLLSPRLENSELLVHVQTGSGMPDEATCTWLTTWLGQGEHPRQVVLILRDGNVAPYLCRKWSGEARTEGLTQLADLLDRRAGQEDADVVPALGEVETCALFTRQRGPIASPQTITGLGLDGMRPPATLRIGSHPMVEKDKEPADTVLVAVDGVPLAVAYEVDEVNRLVVVANASGLVDGALADPRARRLTQALLKNILAFHDHHPHAAWVGSLRVREADPQDLNLLSFLRSAPFAWPLWHLLILLAVCVLSGAAWLGRRELRRNRQGERFARHIEALGQHYADAARHDPQVAREAAAALATAWGRPLPPTTIADTAAALAWLAAAAVPAPVPRAADPSSTSTGP